MIATPKYQLSMAGIPIMIGTLSGEAALLCRLALNFSNHLNPAHPHFGKREPLSAQILKPRPEAASVFAVRVAVREFLGTVAEYASSVPGGTDDLWIRWNIFCIHRFVCSEAPISPFWSTFLWLLAVILSCSCFSGWEIVYYRWNRSQNG